MTDIKGRTQLWREALEAFDRLLELPDEQRRSELAALAASRPDVHAQVLGLLQADAQAEAQAAFEEGAELPRVEATLDYRDHLDEDDSAIAGTALGPWQVDRLIGRGGMGEVLEAHRVDGAFDLRVAIKLLKRGLDTDAVMRRFLLERRILARLEHPNIARLLDAGATADGRPYLVMEYVAGTAITDYVRTAALATADMLRLMITVCSAVQTAHAQHIVHRDLKPSNVLVTADGQVKLLDFGIAKLLDEQSEDMTQQAGTGSPMTPNYAAPEQLLGGIASPATDVYALGVMLYELIAGRLPHRRQGKNIAAITRGLTTESVARPSTVLRHERGRIAEADRLRRLREISGDLDLIVLKALHADPARRYAAAQALADDLRRLLESRPVLARPDSLLYRTRRFVSRNRRSLGQTTAVIVAALLLVSVALHLSARRATIHRMIELGDEQMRTDHAARAATYYNVAYSMGDRSTALRFGLARAMAPVEAMTAWSIGYPGAEYMQASYTPDGQNVLLTDLGKGDPFATLWSLADRQQKFRFDGAPALARARYSRDGARLLLAGSANNLNSKCRSQVLDLRTGTKLLDVEGCTGPGDDGPSPVFVAGDPDLSRVVVVTTDGAAQVWDVATQQKILTLAAAEKIISAAYNDDASRIVTGAADGRVRLWNAADGSPLQLIQALPALPTTAFFADSGRKVATINQAGALQLWDADSGRWLGSPGGIDGALQFAGVDAQGGHLISLSTDGAGFKVWDLNKQTLIAHPSNPGVSYFGSLQFQPGGDQLLTPAEDGTRVWSGAGQRTLGLLEDFGDRAVGASYSPDGRHILTATSRGVARLWDGAALRGEPAMELAHDFGALLYGQSGETWAAFTHDGTRVISVGTDGVARIWNATDGRAAGVLKASDVPLNSGGISADDQLFASGDFKSMVRIWNLATGTVKLQFESGAPPPTRVFFSKSGTVLATFGASAPVSSVRFWNPQTGQAISALQGDDITSPRMLNLSTDGQRVVTAHRDNKARIWDVQTGKLLLTLNGHTGPVWSAYFSPDNHRVLTAGDDNSVKLWDANDGHLLATLDGLSFTPHVAIFDHSGKQVAIGGITAVELWDPASGRRRSLPQGTGAILSFSPDDSMLAGVYSNQVNLWSVEDGQRLANWTDSRAPTLTGVAFSPDGKQLETPGISATGQPVSVWTTDLENRSAATIAALVDCKSPWRVDGEKLVPQKPHPESCATP